MPTPERWHRSPIFRFLIVGGSNTFATVGILVALSFILPGTVAFTIAFALGIGYSLLLTGRWVFDSRLTAPRALLFVAAYLIIYLCGLALIALFGAMNAPPWVNGTSVLLTAPLSFIAGRSIFTHSHLRQADST